jgi:outer membrane protein OmpA-like peptidoglycan-associated protein
MGKRVVVAVVVVVLASATMASAQGTTSGQTPSTPSGSTASQPAQTSSEPTGDTRPATTTFMGDTGLWFVPIGEVLPARKWSASAYRVNYDYNQGFTDVSNWPLTFAFGLGNRAEVFGAWTLVRRIDRDVRPIFLPAQPEAGGVVNDYPFVRQGWSDNQLGDLWLGTKVNLLSEYHQQHPFALAVRGMVKVPTAKDHDEGVGTGKPDFALDVILSKEFNQRVELSGFGGVIFRGDPNDFDLSNGFRWGAGAGFPTRKHLRFTAELHGEKYFDNTVTYTGGTGLIGDDGSFPPSVTPLTSPVNATLGLTWLGNNFFAGAGINWNFNLDGRDKFGSFEDRTGDAAGFQFRVGYHPGVRIYNPPPPPPPPPPPAPPANRPPTVVARCEPCTVEVGKASTVTADASDPDGDTLTYRWSAPTGSLTNPAVRQTPWTAPMQEGPVQLTVQVNDGKGGTADSSVTIQVIRPAVKEVVFEDVHFDFDRYSLRPEALRALDEAVKTLQDNPQLRIEVEGHTCNIGTAEYNLALGDRRAKAVSDYLTSRGISSERLHTTTYGEERPKHDNSREETRRLNRRAALVVRVVQ